jgi:thiol-disulfide isomerase/thioredoxin
METADVALMSSDLRKLPEAIRLGRMTLNKIRQNIAFSIAMKLLVFVIALTGYPALWLAILSDVGTMLLVTLNSMELLGRRPAKANGASEIEKNFFGAPVPATAKAMAACEKGCCEARALLTVKATAACEKGCCEARAPLTVKATAACEKGCCEARAPLTVKATAACEKGCCEARAPLTVKATAACEKGCCETRAPATIRPEKSGNFPSAQFDLSEGQDISAIFTDAWVIVQFAAAWSKPSKALAPHFALLSRSPEFSRNVHFLNIDADVHDDLLNSYGVSALPTYIAFRSGKEHSRLSLSVPDEKLLSGFVSAAFL